MKTKLTVIIIVALIIGSTMFVKPQIRSAVYWRLVGGSLTPTMSNIVDMNNKKIVNVATPTAQQDAVNKDYADSAIQMLDWQESVSDVTNLVTSEPSSPGTGDRYINTTTGISSETAQSVIANYIYEWDGLSWIETAVNEGFAVWVEDEDIKYVFNGTAWVKFGSTITHNNLSGLQGGIINEYYHLTSNQESYLDQSVISGSSPTLDGANITGVDAVNVDIADVGALITATEVEGALQENRGLIDWNTTHSGNDGSDHSDVVLNTTHRTSDGSDHTYIDQDVTGTASPTFTGVTTTLSGTSILADGVVATTQVGGDNSTKIATTAYVDLLTYLWDRNGTVLSPTNSGDDITTTGNIGVGTLSPTTELEVVGDASITRTIYADNVYGYVRNGEIGFAERHISTGEFSDDTISLTATGTIYSTQWGMDGLRLFVTTEDEYIYQYNLTVPYDITTATFTASNNFTVVTNTAGFTLWNDDGTEFTHGGRQARKITLTNPWDISDIASDEIRANISFRNPFYLYDLKWKSDGTRVYGIGRSLDQAQVMSFIEWGVTTPFDFDTKYNLEGGAASDATIHPFPTGVPDTNIVRGFDISPDGGRTYVNVPSTGTEYEVVLGVAWDLSSGTLVNTVTRTQHTDMINYDISPDATTITSITPAGLIVQKELGLETNGLIANGDVLLAYDTSNYHSLETLSDGELTWSALGTDADLNFDFSGATDGDFSINNNDFFVDTSTSYVGIGTTTPSTELEIVGDITSKGTKWTSRTSATDNGWHGVTYGNGLFVAVSDTGTGNRVMTSPDGVNWTLRTSAVDNNWQSVTYGNGLFVAVSWTGTSNRVMTSPDGVNWTLRTSAVDNNWQSVTYGNGLFVAVASTGTGDRVMTSPDGITWTSRTSATDNIWQSVTYGDGLFVAVAWSGTGDRVMTSSDGITWTSRANAVDNDWLSVTYGNGLFVAVSWTGTSNRVMTSPDGVNWTSRTSAADNDWGSITYGNGLFVVMSVSGTGNRVMTSPDGISWTSRTSATDNSWQSVTYGNGLFVAVSYSGIGNRVMTSGKSEINEISHNNIYQGGFEVRGDIIVSGTVDGVDIGTDVPLNTTHRTSDGIDHSYIDQAVTTISSPTLLNLTITNDFTVGTSVLFIDKSNGTVTLGSSVTGTDRLNVFGPTTGVQSGIASFYDSSSAIKFRLRDEWTANSIPPRIESQSALGFGLNTTNNAPFIWYVDGTANEKLRLTSTELISGVNLEVVGDITSKGTKWTSRTSAADNSWIGVTYGNGLFVAISDSGSGNRVMTSPDGINWTIRTSAAENAWRSVVYGNGLFVAVSANGTGNRVMTSPDGVNWTIRTTPIDNVWQSVTYGNGLFVAVASSGFGSNNKIITSPDGINWTIRSNPAENSWNGVTYGNGLFVAVAGSGSGNRVMTSPDGITWTIRSNPANNTWQSVTYGNGLFVATSTSGSGNRVMTSPDGITWTSRTSAANNSWGSVTYGNGLFIAVSYTGTGDRVMTSPDGVNWTSRTSAADNGWFGLTYGNGTFVAVSYTGTGDRVMTSGKPEMNVVSHDNIYQGGMSIFGNVGIGTSSPALRLDVAGGSTYEGLGSDGQISFQYYNGGFRHRIKTFHDAGEASLNKMQFLLWEADVDSIDDLGTKEVMTLQADGNVGIGTTSPDTALEVVSTSNNQLRLKNSADLNAIADLYVDGAGTMVFNLTAGDDTSQNFDFKGEDNNFGLLIRDSSGGSTKYANLYMNDDTTDYLNIVINSSKDAIGLVIDDDNQVGIGTSIPATALEIVGDITVSGTVDGIDVGTDVAANTTHRTSDVHGWTVVATTASSKTAANGEFVLINAATHVLTLPVPSAHDRIGVKVISDIIISIEIRTQTADEIDGVIRDISGLALTATWQGYVFVSDGVGWYIESKF